MIKQLNKTEKIKRLIELNNQLESLKKEVDEIKKDILSSHKEETKLLINGKTLVQLVKSQRVSIDSKALKEKYLDIFNQVSSEKEVSSYRWNLKIEL